MFEIFLSINLQRSRVRFIYVSNIIIIVKSINWLIIKINKKFRELFHKLKQNITRSRHKALKFIMFIDINIFEKLIFQSWWKFRYILIKIILFYSQPFQRNGTKVDNDQYYIETIKFKRVQWKKDNLMENIFPINFSNAKSVPLTMWLEIKFHFRVTMLENWSQLCIL